MTPQFCHLHNHTEYSLLDGANRIPDMVKYAKSMGMEALAISDHGVMFGVMEFYLECKKAGIKPLLGVEAYVAPQGIHKRGGRADNEYFHLLLLAKDLEGYRNLCKLSSIAALEGYYYKPRIDHEILRAHSKGLIGTSACLGSEVCQELMKGDYTKAQYIAGMYAEIFGEGNYFIELQDHGLAPQREIEASLVKIARELRLPLIATNDAHYMCKGDAKPHDVLLCIQTGANVADTKRMKFETEEFYLKSQQEMSTLFAHYPEAIENTNMVAEMCNVELDKSRAPMPEPDLPAGMTSMGYLRELAAKGLQNRSKIPEQSLERLEYELSVIETTGYADYFLLVKEFAEVSRKKGIYFGVRGSAAGSLVSYCVGITDVDPIEYDLTFERFLNPERISMPDIDMDFEDARRDEVIQYVTERFGKDHVAQIVTFGTLGAKAAIKDSGRVMGYSPQETDRICKTIPTLPGWNLDRAYKELTEFREIIESDNRYKSLFDTAKSVEGMARNAGVHAAGVVISREPLVEYVPLTRGSDGQTVTAYEMGILEKIGLLKMDFLGLSNLTVLARCVENINRFRKQTGDLINEPFQISHIPEDDPKTYEMLGRGETIGVFQLEGGGMTRWVQQLKPANVRELAAMVALYRPGPMEHIPKFIDTKFGKIQPEYLDEKMRPILEETYGIIVYQDQVLKLVQALAGFSLGKADVLRRAMGKKDAVAMGEMKVEFVAGAEANGVAASTSERVWELLLPFAGYAFNKAHAVCYSILAYQTAYLKANFPVEYMAGLLSVYLAKEDRVTTFIEECRRQKIPVLPPDVNCSGPDFQIEVLNEKGARGIRFGMVAIKGVGEGIVDAMLVDREENGRYAHLYEFCERNKAAGINRTAVEALIRAGALDSIDINRNKLLAHVEGALQFAEMQHRAKLAGQDSLFGEGDGPASASYPMLPETDRATRSETLAMEKEVMGIYVSDHPLRGLERTIGQNSTHSCATALEADDGAFLRLAGVIAKMKTIVTKAEGKRMASLTLEDFSGQIGLTVFPATYEKLRDVLQKDSVVQVTGYLSHREMRGEKLVEVRVDDVKPLEGSLELGFDGPSSAAGTVTILVRRATTSQVSELKRLVDDHPGDYQVIVQVASGNMSIPVYLVQHVNPTETFVRAVRKGLVAGEIEVEQAFGMGLRA